MLDVAWMLLSSSSVAWRDANIFFFSIIFHHLQVNNMRQAHMQQLEYQNGSYSKSMQSQLSPAGHSGSSRQHSNAHYQQHLYHSNSGSRNHRFSEQPGPSRHQQSGHGRDNYSHQGDRSSNRQQQSRGSYRPQDNKGGSGHSDNRWRRYWHTSRGTGGVCAKTEVLHKYPREDEGICHWTQHSLAQDVCIRFHWGSEPYASEDVYFCLLIFKALLNF